ncbi:putative membrane protein YeiB [Nocardiopsis sp. Huas11]|uniref:DUF418 domain-containing protein n=1 Tax=Nocardiopsis sp. Huas11 TaxID=2183912 RepID=UPI000F2A290B|nr:DUF418 domain-containing protein [Nocardiopsis sp. Huas11]RKS06904.1 putative membrane protein YeiB [Nocardiopsis sp. Huas11]
MARPAHGSPAEETARPARGGVRADERALAPDLARGFMLLMIVLSNTGFHLYAARHGASGWHPVDGSLWDAAVRFAMLTALDVRAYPMFAFLFGYGMVRLYQRQRAAGTSERRAMALLRRRGLWLIVFGAVHAALLLAGDILGLYGLIGLVLGWLFLRRADRTLLVWAGILTALLAALAALTFLGFLDGDDTSARVPDTVAYAAVETSYAASVLTRLETWSLGVTLLGSLFGFAFHAAMLLGCWAARHRLLEEPGRHLRLLGWTAGLGITVGWLGGLPVALDHIGVLAVPEAAHGPDGPVFMWQVLTGLPGGVGYAALFGLIAHWLSQRARASVPVRAVSALGQRSLSGYLAHSVLFSPVLAAWGLGLGAHLNSASMALFTVGVWLVTVAGAYALQRAGRRGPAEALLRRLVYGRVDRG